MGDNSYIPKDRRPVASRGWPVMGRLASALARAGVSPNAISVVSVGFAVAAGAALAGTGIVEGWPGRLCFLVAALCMQLRLLCNLLDGMVAVEREVASPLGELYNEAPDRVSDVVILVGAGYAAGGAPALGYVAAVLALFVAYVRALGAVAGAPQSFLGPMAKQQRMMVVTAAAVWSALVPAACGTELCAGGWGAMALALAIVIPGCVVTAMRRLAAVARSLRGA